MRSSPNEYQSISSRRSDNEFDIQPVLPASNLIVHRYEKLFPVNAALFQQSVQGAKLDDAVHWHDTTSIAGAHHHMTVVLADLHES
jgi:hypothetical protein